MVFSVVVHMSGLCCQAAHSLAAQDESVADMLEAAGAWSGMRRPESCCAP